jgi:hypothetical protein
MNHTQNEQEIAIPDGRQQYGKEMRVYSENKPHHCCRAFKQYPHVKSFSDLFNLHFMSRSFILFYFLMGFLETIIRLCQTALKGLYAPARSFIVLLFSFLVVTAICLQFQNIGYLVSNDSL